MPKKLEQLEQPTKQGIEQLFRDLFAGNLGHKFSEEKILYDRLDAELDFMQEKFEQSKEYVKLKGQLTQAKNNYYESEKILKDKIRKVYRQFKARGLTPKVKEMIQKLVDELDNEGG